MDTVVKEQLKVATPAFQEMVSRAQKCSGMIDSIPATMLMEIKLQDNTLSITTTDGPNWLVVKQDNVQGNNFSIVVNSQLFSQLISRLTSSEIELTVEESSLVVKSNGIYKLELPLDAGEVVKNLPLPFPFDFETPKVHITSEQVKSICTISKASKAQTREFPALFSYYCNDTMVVTSDSYKCCFNPIKLFESPVCLPDKLVDYLPLAGDDSGLDVYQNDTIVAFCSSKGTLYGAKSTKEDLQDYPIDILISSKDNQAFTYSAMINRTLLVNALERMSLFTQLYDRNCVMLTFTKDALTLSCKQTSSNESIKYLQPLSDDVTYTCSVDVTMLMDQLKVGNREDVQIKFECSPQAESIQVNCNETTQLLGLLLEDTQS